MAATGMGTVNPSVDFPPESSRWEVVGQRLQAATLGEFELLTEIGRGGMAAVYLARELSLNRPVAIKVMAPGLLLGAAMVNRFRQEAITVANLQHAHIVSIHAVRQVDDLHYFVMQFVPGRTIEGVLKEHGGLSVPVTLAWLFQIGSALGYAHRRGVIHRDVKPGNILLNIDGDAVVTDFGIAKVTENPSFTQTGAVVGTPLYMSPEQCYAKELTGASDQYSLGIVAYEMLAGHPPFSGASFALMRAHTDDPPPPLRAIRPDVPAHVESALMRMLAKRPDDRFVTMIDALAALGAVPLTPTDPIHTTLQDLAAAKERLDSLRDVLRTPASPVPRTRERSKVAIDTPRTPVPTVEVLIVSITRPPAGLEPGATETLQATVTTASGRPAPRHDVAWQTSDPAVVTIDSATGRLTAKSPGRAVVTASVGDVRDTAEILVEEPKPTHVDITIPTDSIEVGANITLSAVVTNRFGVKLQRRIEWAVDKLGVVAIVRDAAEADSSTIAIRAVSPGMTGIYASCGGVMSRVALSVVAAPVTEPAPAPTAPIAPPRVATPATPTHKAPDAPPAASPIEPPRPSRPDIGIPTILSGPKPAARSGTVAAPAPERPVTQPAPSATIVMSPTAPKTAPLEVPQPSNTSPASSPRAAAALPVDAAVAEPPTGSHRRWAAAAAVVLVIGVGGYLLTLGGSATSQGVDPAETPAKDSRAAATAPASAPQVDPGTVAKGPDAPNAIKPPTDPSPLGTAKQTPPTPSPATKETAPAPVARRIQLTASRSDAMLPGQTMAINATVRDASGATMRGASVRWTSSDPRVVTVDPATGAVKAVSEGTARISARSGNVSDALVVSVSAPPPDPTVVTSLELGEVGTMTVGETTRLSAAARNALGTAATGATIHWTSSNPDVASVDPNGSLTARGPGSATIQATSGDRSAERRVTVRAREVVAPKVDSPAAPPPKTDAELTSEVRAVLTRYTRGIETGDTSAMRGAFPGAPGDKLVSTRKTFEDSRDGLQMRGSVELLEIPRDAVGNQVRARGQYRAFFYSKATRREVQFDASFSAVVQRTPSGWRIVSIR